MKKFAAALVLITIASAALAHGGYGYRPSPQYYGGYHGHSHSTWVAPAIIGGVIGYSLARPPVYYYPPAPPVIVTAPEPVPAYPAPLGYHYEQRLDPGCNCWRWFVVPNNLQ